MFFEVALRVVGLYFGVRVGAALLRPLLRSLRLRLKGAWGEFQVNHILRRYVKNNEGCELLRDLMVRTPDNQTHQIDSLLLTPQGIFCIETKNYIGTIRGSEKDKNWEHIYGLSDQISKPMQNVARQNAGHIDALRCVLQEHGFGHLPFYNIVAFNNDCRIDVDCTTAAVIYYNGLENFIPLLGSPDPVISPKKLHRIRDCLERENITSLSERMLHASRARMAMERNDQDADIESIVSKAIELNPGVQPSATAHQKYKAAPGEPPIHSSIHTGPKIRGLLGEDTATLRINGREGTVKSFYEGAHRTADGSVAATLEEATHLVCPWSRQELPLSEESNLYAGLWASYFTKGEDQAKVLALRPAYGPERQTAVIRKFAEDPRAFRTELKSTLWYQKIRDQSEKGTLDGKIQEASTTREPQTTGPSVANHGRER